MWLVYSNNANQRFRTLCEVLIEWREKAQKRHRITTTHCLLLILIAVGCAFLYSENRSESSENGERIYEQFRVDTFEPATLSKEQRKTLLEKLIAQDEQEALIDGSGEEGEWFHTQNCIKYNLLNCTSDMIAFLNMSTLFRNF